MKKRKSKILIYLIAVLITVYYVLRFTGAIGLSSNPTFANEPNIPIDSRIITSNLIKAKSGDFISYKFNDKYLGDHVRVHRLVGLENDTIEIKNGIVFLNNENFDKNLNLVHYYKFSIDHLKEMYQFLPDYAFTTIKKIDSISLKVLLEDFKKPSLKFKTTKVLEENFMIDKEIQSIYKKPWNKDNFGPIIIPKGKVFVLGDNRDFTFDSRNVGFIDKKDIKNVVFKVF